MKRIEGRDSSLQRHTKAGTQKNWSRVIRSDESKFCLFGSDGRRCVRHPVGKKFDPKFTKMTVKHGGGNVMVYGCFTSSGVGPLVRVDGKMDSIQFRDILRDVTVPFYNKKYRRKWVYQMDNDPKHKSQCVTQWLESKKVEVLPWPSQSPDLNPIEHLWDELGRRVRGRKHKNKDDLFAELESEWKQLQPSVCAKLVGSMSSRIEAVIKSRGYPTKY